MIPLGYYCYDENGRCPFWRIINSRPYQQNGYCLYMHKGDWGENGTFILWDQCKECPTTDADVDFEIERAAIYESC